VEKGDTIKKKGVSSKAIQWRLFPFSLKDKASLGFSTPTPTLSPLRVLCPRQFFANIFHPRRQPSLTMTLRPSFKQRASLFKRCGEGLKSFKGNAPIMEF